MCVSAEMKTSDWTGKETNSHSRERERVEDIGPTWISKKRLQVSCRYFGVSNRFEDNYIFSLKTEEAKNNKHLIMSLI